MDGSGWRTDTKTCKRQWSFSSKLQGSPICCRTRVASVDPTTVFDAFCIGQFSEVMWQHVRRSRRWSRVISRCGLRGVRVGEASNPGPPRQQRPGHGAFSESPLPARRSTRLQALIDEARTISWLLKLPGMWCRGDPLGMHRANVSVEDEESEQI